MQFVKILDYSLIYNSDLVFLENALGVLWGVSNDIGSIYTLI
jgi:hypothetical protein